MWEIEDDTLDSLPKYVSKTIRELRHPNNLGMAWYAGGSIFFMDGERLDLSPPLKWPQVEKILEARSRKRKP